MKYPELPVKAQGIVYRQKGSNVEILLLKRSEADGGFWQMLTGTLEFDESIEDCLARELKEETGITKIKSMSEEVYRFSWQKQDYTVVEMVYGIEVPASSEVLLSQEHQDSQWLTLDEAHTLLEHDSGRAALRSFQEIVLA